MTDKEREALVERLAEIIRLAHPGNAYGVDGAQKIARAALAEAMRDFSMF